MDIVIWRTNSFPKTSIKWRSLQYRSELLPTASTSEYGFFLERVTAPIDLKSVFALSTTLGFSRFVSVFEVGDIQSLRNREESSNSRVNDTTDDRGMSNGGNIDYEL